MPRTHALSATAVHRTWDRAHEPVLEIEPGDTIEATTLDASGGYYGPASTTEDARRKPAFAGHPLTGPVLVRSAQPGDLLEVQVLAIEPGSWGYTSIAPDRGLLTDDFPGHHLVIWDLADPAVARAPFGAAIPARPFCGVLGVAPAEPGPISTTPPRRTGGNLDVRQLVAGSTLYLPVEVEGALFSVGDAHAAQGDGEVCNTAVEVPAAATLRLLVHPGRATPGPRARLPRLVPPGAEGEWYVAMASASDLLDASRQAVRSMIEWLVAEYRLDRRDAYVLASVAVDLRVSQLVNRDVTVSAFFPTAVMTG